MGTPSASAATRSSRKKAIESISLHSIEPIRFGHPARPVDESLDQGVVLLRHQFRQRHFGEVRVAAAAFKLAAGC